MLFQDGEIEVIISAFYLFELCKYRRHVLRPHTFFRTGNKRRRAAEEIGTQSAELAEELVLTTAELSFLQDRRTALENLGIRTQLDIVKAVAQALIQAERYGTPIAQALRVLAQEGRDERMNDAEKKAAALPPKLTVPMILFFLPVLIAVILGPAGIQVSDRF